MGKRELYRQINCDIVYYDVPVANTMGRQGRQEVSDIELFMNFTDRFASTRLWEIRVAQIPFSQRAPSGCLQYFTSPSGIIQTFNFAENGRHLANQNYRACVRQEIGMCSISYEPCTEQSFRIGQRNPANTDNMQDTQSVSMDTVGSDVTSMMTEPNSTFYFFNCNLAQAPATTNQQQTAPISETPVQDEALADPVQDQQVSADTAEDVVEGSGGGDIPPIAPVQPGFFSSFFSRRAFSYRQSRQYFSQCNDRITMPCIVEDFIAAGMGNVPDCTPIHCGDSLCAPGVLPCRVESTVTPFGLGVRFGDGLDKGSPEDNIGACLRFSQVNCA
ncbi:hypothetical protein HA402_011983 [Bradysia odoriphaga]|nr:hypothetical protein HA402_011983 [Bradysia odoriphaga]